jgi:hypothetical protein
MFTGDQWIDTHPSWSTLKFFVFVFFFTYNPQQTIVINADSINTWVHPELRSWLYCISTYNYYGSVVRDKFKSQRSHDTGKRSLVF